MKTVMILFATMLLFAIHITDKKHGRSLVAGNNADGNIYHQTPNARRNATWHITLLVDELNIPKEI